jgi:hypothetical protein
MRSAAPALPTRCDVVPKTGCDGGSRAKRADPQLFVMGERLVQRSRSVIGGGLLGRGWRCGWTSPATAPGPSIGQYPGVVDGGFFFTDVGFVILLPLGLTT